MVNGKNTKVWVVILLSEKVQCRANKASINHVIALITPRNKTNKDDSFNYITSNKKG